MAVVSSVAVATSVSWSVTVSYEQSTYTVAEGSSVTVKVKLDVAPERTVTIPINKTDQGGASSSDYSGVPLMQITHCLTPGSITFGLG